MRLEHEIKAQAEFKLVDLRAGKKIVTNDAEMDKMIDLDGDTMMLVRSVPNPARVGLLDQYVAWIDE